MNMIVFLCYRRGKKTKQYGPKSWRIGFATPHNFKAEATATENWWHQQPLTNYWHRPVANETRNLLLPPTCEPRPEPRPETITTWLSPVRDRDKTCMQWQPTSLLWVNDFPALPKLNPLWTIWGRMEVTLYVCTIAKRAKTIIESDLVVSIPVSL